MLKGFKYAFFLALAGCLLWIQPLAAADGLGGNLVSVDWLEKNLKKPNVLVLDASPTQSYLAKHVPGAVSVSFTAEQGTSQGVNLSYGGGTDYFTDRENQPYPLQEMPVKEMSKVFQTWGVSADKKIVIYDQGVGMLATRLFFSLYYHGFPTRNLFILNGGLPKWQEKGMPVSKDVTPLPKKGTFKVSKRVESIKVSLPEFIAASADPVHNVLLEGLNPNWHFGETLSYSRRGHIPYAIMLPSVDFFNADKTFKSPAEIKKMLAYMGIRPEQQILTH